MSRPSTLVLNTLLVLISLTMSLVLAEIGMRLLLYGNLSPSIAQSAVSFRRPDSVLGWRLEAGVDVSLRTKDYSTRFQTNSKGFNDIEHTYGKASAVYRVVVLGDSFMEAYQVPREASFSRQLSADLNQGMASGNKFEVINLGVGGFGTAQEYLMLREQGSLYEPDMVLLAWLPVNDVRNNHKELETMLWGVTDTAKVRGRPFANIKSDGSFNIDPPDETFITYWMENINENQNQQKGELEKLKDELMLWYYVERLVGRLKEQEIPKYDPNVWLGGYINEFDTSLSRQEITNEQYILLWDEAEKVSWRIIKEVEKYSEKIGAKFCVFTVPSRFQVEKEYRKKIMSRFPSIRFDAEKLNKKLDLFAKQENLCLIELLPEFRRQFEGTGIPLHHQYEDRHWNEEGQALAARLVAAALRSRKIESHR